MQLSADGRETLEDALRIYTETAGDAHGRAEREDAVRRLEAELREPAPETDEQIDERYHERLAREARARGAGVLQKRRLEQEENERTEAPQSAPERPHERDRRERTDG